MQKNLYVGSAALLAAVCTELIFQHTLSASCMQDEYKSLVERIEYYTETASIAVTFGETKLTRRRFLKGAIGASER